MTRFRLTIEYDGRPYMGWQRQPHGPSVQQAIEDACQGITGEEVLVYGAGRTDSGVHALAMTAHVDVEKDIDAFRLGEGLNAKLRSEPIAILDCEEVDSDWHARFDCLGRRYLYRIVNRRSPLALEAGRAWRIPQPLDEQAMHRGAQLLVGKHDFTTFRSAHCQSESPLKTLGSLAVSREDDAIVVQAAARSFLHHQVRSMVGCLALVGIGRWSEGDLRDALEAADRQRLGLNAPPDGLYFVGADYAG
ncbi:tRNA pseudouridine(38-40) synthase TruA [Parasphingopyxis lamellibrachiae]|uniref:tRNA pseudouridine synthase A n=1 Tax=Parasphingopyxis lamellibrachiae TaxID=680125 RepID=A0A3D9FF08_9SPHN|nr:tRNA pseudouridine(38-40) synthase TruA [Parasphingopyxis lamellibrachiae]RED15661.1 tRNA pseudouridine(38-40) synthase [Parasphingopyxis lamellibrachiae]